MARQPPGLIRREVDTKRGASSRENNPGQLPPANDLVKRTARAGSPTSTRAERKIVAEVAGRVMTADAILIAAIVAEVLIVSGRIAKSELVQRAAELILGLQ